MSGWFLNERYIVELAGFIHIKEKIGHNRIEKFKKKIRRKIAEENPGVKKNSGKILKLNNHKTKLIVGNITSSQKLL